MYRSAVMGSLGEGGLEKMMTTKSQRYHVFAEVARTHNLAPCIARRRRFVFLWKAAAGVCRAEEKVGRPER